MLFIKHTYTPLFVPENGIRNRFHQPSIEAPNLGHKCDWRCICDRCNEPRLNHLKEYISYRAEVDLGITKEIE